MTKRTILGVHISQRVQSIPDVQALFTEYGCNIKTRVGMHDVQGDYCSPSGLVVLEMLGESEDIDQFYTKLGAVAGVDVQRMDFAE
jgi:hypothetical protein